MVAFAFPDPGEDRPVQPVRRGGLLVEGEAIRRDVCDGDRAHAGRLGCSSGEGEERQPEHDEQSGRGERREPDGSHHGANSPTALPTRAAVWRGRLATCRDSRGGGRVRTGFTTAGRAAPGAPRPVRGFTARGLVLGGGGAAGTGGGVAAVIRGGVGRDDAPGRVSSPTVTAAVRIAATQSTAAGGRACCCIRRRRSGRASTGASVGVGSGSATGVVSSAAGWSGSVGGVSSPAIASNSGSASTLGLRATGYAARRVESAWWRARRPRSRHHGRNLRTTGGRLS